MVFYSSTQRLVDAKIKEIKNLMQHFKTNTKCVEK